MSRRLVTLTTDFGLRDGFVGVMRGVILRIFPAARIVDITHEIAPQDVAQGAFLLANSVPYFPENVVHLAVVDPGVGSERKPIAVRVGKTIFVGPDNGLLSLAVAECEMRLEKRARAIHLNRARYWLPRVSNTFHGRDVFSPSAAYLAKGIPFSRLGSPIREWVSLEGPGIEYHEGKLIGRVIYIDRYGNIVTDISDGKIGELGSFNSAPEKEPVIEIGGHEIHGLVKTYSDVAKGEIAALIGSPWKLEIAQREGNAARTLDVKIGDPVIVRRKNN